MAAATTTTATPTTIVTDAAQISNYNRGPISGPTVLTLPTSCLATPTSVSGGVLYFGHDWPYYWDTACYPSSTTTDQNTQSAWNLYYYSPAVSCPSGWYGATTATSTFGGFSSVFLSLGSATTAVLCCPSGYTAAGVDHQCQSNYPVNTKTAQTVTYKAPSTDVNSNWIATATSTVTHTVTGVDDWSIFGDGIPIWFQESDQKAFTAASETSSSTSSASSSGPTSATSPSVSPTTAPSGLSTGAKAGIGVGVALGVLLLAAVVAFFIFKRRKRYEAAPRDESAIPAELHNNHTKREYVAPGELSAQETERPVVHELYSDEGNNNMTKTTYR